MILVGVVLMFLGFLSYVTALRFVDKGPMVGDLFALIGTFLVVGGALVMGG